MAPIVFTTLDAIAALAVPGLIFGLAAVVVTATCLKVGERPGPIAARRLRLGLVVGSVIAAPSAVAIAGILGLAALAN